MIKVLHVLDHFLPLNSGYTVRSRYVLESQRRVLGVKPVILVAPQNANGPTTGPEEWKGIPIYTSDPADGILRRPSVLKMSRNLWKLRSMILRVARQEKPDVIHAHSPVLNAWPAIWAGRLLRIPVVYEIRAFWEDAAVMHGSTTEGSLRYEATRFIETAACKRTAAVVTICDGLRTQLKARRIEEEKIFLLPNGVDPGMFRPGADGSKIRRALSICEDETVVGFIGSLYRYEGLHLLVQALAMLAKEHPRLRGLIVGEGFGNERQELEELAERLGISGRVIFAGGVAHELVPQYYSAIDVLAYPRVRSRLLDLVTPLKILEGMAHGRPVLGSDVGGIREIIRDGENGRLFAAGRPEQLAETLASLISDRAQRERLGASGRCYIQIHRKWDTLIEGHRATYRHVGFDV